jgi:hypothetical protein
MRTSTLEQAWRFAAWLSAAAVLAASVQSSAQQQRYPRADWPCGGRLDPSYFQVAEGSGGHLLLLAPHEIGDSASLLTAFSDHPQTIFRLAGSATPGVHELNVPIDSSVDSVLFSISIQCLQMAEVVAPSGAPIVAGENVTDLSNFRAQRMVIIRRPQPGVWSVRLAGSGVSAVVAQARTAIGIGEVEFAPSASDTFSRIPSAGIENRVRIRMSGDVDGLEASLVNGEWSQTIRLPLVHDEAARTYVSRFTPGSASFRLSVSGKDANGFVVQRTHAPLLMPR